MSIRVLLLLLVLVQAAASAGKPRNVVFILTDDHRYDVMGCAGHPFVETPNLDRIANEGVYFEDGVVTTALCSPSRASILTGLYTHKHGVVDNGTPEPEGTRFFAETLDNAGYDTAFIGKWHMGNQGDGPRPGFDRWVSFKGQGVYYPRPNFRLNVDGERVPLEGYITDELTDYAVDWLDGREPGETPFFLYLSHKAVHSDFQPSPRHRGRYADVELSLPTGTETLSGENVPRWVRDQRNSWHGIDFPYHSTKTLESLYRSYCESVLAVDDSVGRVMDKLEEMGVLDETLIVYMGDNGFLFGEKGLIDKRVAYEPSLRVPMLARCPELFEGGTRVDRVVANIDMAPTILDVAGLEPEWDMDGRSFVKLAQGGDDGWRDEFLYVYYWEWSFPQTPTQFALREDRYKFITYYGLWDVEELYDLEVDPGETTNLIAVPEHARRVTRMRKQVYDKLAEKGGMTIPLRPRRSIGNGYRFGPRGGDDAAGFPDQIVIDTEKPGK
ncbi:MAG: sulfatase [Planctomycetota bacterium]